MHVGDLHLNEYSIHIIAYGALLCSKCMAQTLKTDGCHNDYF